MSFPQAVFFDLDGTLLDTALDFHTATNLVMEAELRQPLDLATLRSWVTNGSVGIIQSAFDIEQDHPEFNRLRDDLLNHYVGCLTDKTQLFSGLDKTLELLEGNGIPWGVVTNKPVRFSKPIIELLTPGCATLVCPDHVVLTKPDPEGLFIAAKDVSANPERCLYVGDHERDIQAGKRAGMKTVAVEWGYIDSMTDPSEWQADYCIQTPEQLPDIVLNAF
jgi:N-acetyl-D-muramate 6-phosphate phosphatase